MHERAGALALFICRHSRGQLRRKLAPVHQARQAVGEVVTADDQAAEEADEPRRKKDQAAEEDHRPANGPDDLQDAVA